MAGSKAKESTVEGLLEVLEELTDAAYQYGQYSSTDNAAEIRRLAVVYADYVRALEGKK